LLIDVHCHIDDKSFDNDRDEVLCRASNVVVLNAGVDPFSNRKTLEITDKYRNVKACLGLHPEFIANFSEYVIGKEITWISSQAKRIVAISEIGLDYYWVKDEEQQEKQRILFRRMLALADDLGLPVIVHSRDAQKDTLTILREFPRLKVVLHGFSEPDNMGHFVSVAPNIYRNKMKQRQVVALPMDVLLTETDSPLLGIDPKERNEPRNVLQVAKRISELKSVSVDAVIAAISRNAKKLFFSWWGDNSSQR